MFKRPRVLIVLLAVGLALPAIAVAGKSNWWNSIPYGTILSADFRHLEVDDAKLVGIFTNGRKHDTKKLELRANGPVTAFIDGTAQTIEIPPFELKKHGAVSILVNLTPTPATLTPGWKCWKFNATGTAAVNSRAPFNVSVTGCVEKEDHEYELEVCFYGTTTVPNNTVDGIQSSSVPSNGTAVIVLRGELEGETKVITNGGSQPVP